MGRGDIAPLPSPEHPPAGRIVFQGARSPGPSPAQRALRRPRCVTGRDVRGGRCRDAVRFSRILGFSEIPRNKCVDEKITVNALTS